MMKVVRRKTCRPELRILFCLEVLIALIMAVISLTSGSCSIPNIKKFAECAKKCYIKLHGTPTTTRMPDLKYSKSTMDKPDTFTKTEVDKTPHAMTSEGVKVDVTTTSSPKPPRKTSSELYRTSKSGQTTSGTTGYLSAIFSTNNETFNGRNITTSSPVGSTSSTPVIVSTTDVSVNQTKSSLSTKPSFLSTILSRNNNTSSTTTEVAPNSSSSFSRQHRLSSQLSASTAASANTLSTSLANQTGGNTSIIPFSSSADVVTSNTTRGPGESNASDFTTQIVVINEPEAFPNQAATAVKIYYVFFFLCTFTLLVIFIVYMYD